MSTATSDPPRTTSAPSPGPTPALAVAGAAVRAAIGAAMGPVHFAAFLLQSRARREELRADLRSCAEPERPPELRPLPDRPLRVFLSCAEVSGENHAANLLAALERRASELGAPSVEWVGFGGETLRSAGMRVIADTLEQARMGVLAGLGNLPFYLRALTAAAREFRDGRPAVCVCVDSPALHVPLGRLARRYGIPVLHFVTPQYWAWAPWRVRDYRAAVDRALTILPFERAWFDRHGIRTVHVGHPLVDALAKIPPTRPDPANRILVLLPGSRESVIERNLPWMLLAAARLRLDVPDLAVVVANDRSALRPTLQRHLEAGGASAWAELRLGDLHDTLGEARAALSVSGTILLDLLHHRLPSVVVYRLKNAWSRALYSRLVTTPWFSSVNLLAGREVFPEFAFAGRGPLETISAALLRCYKDEAWREACIDGLETAAERLGPGGAIQRAAEHALDLATGATRPDPSPRP